VGGGHAGDNEIESNDTPIADRYQVVVHVTAETSRRTGCDSTVVYLREDEQTTWFCSAGTTITSSTRMTVSGLSRQGVTTDAALAFSITTW
jgi:hypothetical protein